MNDQNKTKAQLISELQQLRQHVAELETAAKDRAGNASFLTMAEAAASAIFVFRDSVFLYANPATAKLTGYAVEELIGRNIWTLVHPEFLDRNERVLAFQRGEAVSPKSEFKIVTKGGDTRWLNADATITEFGGSPAVLTIAYDSSEYKVAQEALRLSEERYQNIMETAQEAIWVVDPRAITTYVNQRLAEMLGYPPEEILGHSVLEFVDPAEHQETLHHLERGRQGFRERLDHRFRCRDGSYVWAIVSTTPLFDSAGEFIGGLAMLIDITERKRTERALKENEALLKAAIENLPFELWARETAGRCIIQNPYSVLQWGDQIGNTLEQMSPDHAIQERWLGYQQRALKGEVVKAEFEIADGDQAGCYYSVVAPICVDAEVTGVLGVNIDITDRKRGEEALRVAQVKLHHVLLYSPAIIYSLKVEGSSLITQWISESLTRLTGYEVEEAFSGTWWVDHIHPDDRSRVIETMQLLFVADRLVLEYRFQHKQKGYVWLHDEIRLLRDDSGNPIEAIGSWVDVTERREAEAALRDSEERFRLLVTSMKDTVFTLDREHRITSIFGSLTNGSEADADRFLGKTARDLFGPEAARVHEEADARALAGEQIVYEWVLVNNQSTLYYQTSLSPMRNHKGEVTGLVGVGRDITEGKRAEQSIRFQANLLDKVWQAAIATDADGNITYWNRFAETLYGWSAAEVIGRDVLEILPTEKSLDQAVYIMRLLKSGNGWTGEFLVRDKDHRNFMVMVTSSPIYDDEGTMAGIVSVSFDITERKLAEEALRASEERYRDLVENARDIIYSHDLKGNYTSVNRAVEQITGYTREEALNLNFEQSVAPEFVENARGMIAAKIAGQKETVYDLEIMAKDGRRITVEVNTRLVYQDDVPIGVHGIARDVTERKLAELALRESQSHLQAILDNCPAMIFEKDLDGRYLQINRQFEQTFNVVTSDVLGRTDDELFPPKVAATFRATDRAVLDAGRSLEFDETTTYADGPHAYIVHKFPLLDASGNVYGVGAISTDITERKRAEEALKRSEERFRSYFELGLIGIAITSPTKGWIEVNDRMCEMLGYERSDLWQTTWAELTHPDDLAANLANFNRVLAGEIDGYSIDKRFIRKDGQTIYATIAVTCLRSPDGSVDYFVALLEDITDRKRMEDALRNSERKYKDIVTFSSVGIYQVHPDGTIVTANAALAQILGYDSPDELLSINLERDVYVDPAERRKLIDKLVATDYTGEIELQWKRRDGTPVWIQLSAHAVKDANSATQYFEGFVLDVTERKRADELLRRQKAELAALHDIELEISAESDLNRVLDIVTQRAARLLKAAHCSTYITDRHQGDLKIVASLDPELIGYRLKLGEGLAGLVAVTAEAKVIEDYGKWDARAAAYSAKGFGPSLGAPLKWQQSVIGAISLSRSQGEDSFTDEDSRLLQQLAAEASIAIHQATLIDELQESRRRLQVLSHRLIDAQEAERKRLARELHDQIGQALTAIQISLQGAKSTPDGGTASIVEDCLAIIDESLQLVHDLSFDLRPSLLDDLGLGPALRWYVERVTARADLIACLNVDALGRRFSSEVETACFRIAQESLTNVVRHASARTVSVTLVHKEDCLKLMVQDDGVGFDVHEALDRKGSSTCLGLQGMRERATALSGIVEIKSNPKSGTEIAAIFPL